MSFFPHNSVTLVPGTEDLTELQYELEPLRDGSKQRKAHLKQVLVKDQARNLPKPEHTALDYQLRVGAKLDDYSGTMFMTPRHHELSQEQADKYLNQLDQSIQQNAE